MAQLIPKILKQSKINKTKIIVDVERMKHPFTGLYYYCRDLALNLEKYHADKFDFYFFSYPRVKFPKHLKRILRNHFDKYYLTKPKKYKVWHSTWQDTKYIPRNNMKFVYTIHDLNFLYTDKSETKKNELLQAVQDKVDKADAITVISHFVKEDVEKNLNTRGKKIHVIHNGVDFEEFPDFDTPNYRPKKKYLFTVGTVLYKKHFHILPSILVGNDYELIIAGIHPDKSYITQIQNEIKKYNVADRVHLVGTITAEEKYWYMKNAEAFLFPSISEGFGLPPIEAMRLGKPTFLSRLTSLPEIGGEHAYYFDSFEPENMRKVLAEGIKDYYSNNKKSAIIKWSKQFNWEKASAEYVEIYKKAITGEANSGGMQEVATKYPITAIITTLNEETNIEAAIQTVQFADEIIVIDSLSTDNTVAIAEKLGVKVIHRAFDNFSNQKNYAIDEAKNDWIYILDADERVNFDLRNELTTIVSSKTNDAVAYESKMNYYFMGKLMKHTSFKTKKVYRLFNKKSCRYDGSPVHEQLKIDGKKGVLKNLLDHKSDKSIDDFIKTQSFYADLKAEELFQKNDTNLFVKALFKPPFRFVKHFIIQLGFLDGFQGLVFSGIQSYGVFIRYVKLWKLNRNKQ